MKDIINKIIQDLGDDKPIKGILLKSQIVASKLNNKEFEKWIRNEQNGYPNPMNVPKYRVLNAIVKVDVSIPYSGLLQNLTIPTGIFDSEVINECMFHTRITQSLSEIENLCNDQKNKNLSVTCPAMAYPEVNKYVSGNVEKVWQEIPASSLFGIVDTFKSKLLSFFLDLDKKIEAGVDFSKIEGQKEINQIMNNYYINSVVANTGNGTVNTGDIAENSPTQFISDTDKKNEISDLVSKLISEANKIDNDDLKNAVGIISEECKKPSWAKKTLRLAFNAVQGIATGIAANEITPLVTQALALL